MRQFKVIDVHSERQMYGEYFGYPKCCVKYFVENFDELPILNKRRKPLHGSGFIPCPDCSLNKTEEELIKEINENRKYEKPFAPFLETCPETGIWIRRKFS